MKIQKLQNFVERKINLFKYNKEQALVNRYFKIRDCLLPYDSYEQMDSARKVIANYARHNGVMIEVSRPIADIEESAAPETIKNLSERVKLVVTNLLTNARETRFPQVINDKNPNKVFLEKTKEIMVYDRAEGTQRIAQVKSFFEENFLRNLYRNIEEMTDSVTK